MTYALLVFLFVGVVLFHGYRKGKQNRKKSMTNGDRIRNMTDEEIFHNYYRLIPCKECRFRNECSAYRNIKIAGDIENYKKCREMWLKWLGSEAENVEK